MKARICPSCCVDEIIKQYRQFMKGNNQIVWQSDRCKPSYPDSCRAPRPNLQFWLDGPVLFNYFWSFISGISFIFVLPNTSFTSVKNDHDLYQINSLLCHWKTSINFTLMLSLYCKATKLLPRTVDVLSILVLLCRSYVPLCLSYNFRWHDRFPE